MGEHKEYDLAARTLAFARRVRALVHRLPRTVANREDAAQLVRASGSVGANYIEANESLGRKDFLMHAKVSRKEAKESRYWLQLVEIGDAADLKREQSSLIQEATELLKIFNAIVVKAGT